MIGEVESKSGGRVFLLVIALVVGLPLLYCLSFGPAKLVASKLHPSGKVLQIARTFYHPLKVAGEYKLMKGPFEAYITFWLGI